MKQRQKRFYEFDKFRIDVEERQLWRDGKPVPLTPRVFDILLALVENSGSTLKTNELMDRVWADAFVGESNLTRNISTLRKALGEDFHKPRFIKTVPKRGYCFVSAVREIVEAAEIYSDENRTKYSVALGPESTQPGSGDAEASKLWPRFLVVAGVAVLMLGFALVRVLEFEQADAASYASDKERHKERGTENDEAFELFKKGRGLWENRSVEGLYQATVYLEQAVQLDPNFALGHSALADAYAFDLMNWKKAESSANTAIRLDPNVGAPYATIGFVRMFWEWKFKDAERYFKQAIALSPDYAPAHQWYALNLAARGRGGGAIAEMRQALALEPNSIVLNADMCQVLYFSRKYDQAINQCLKTLEMDPNFQNAHTYLYEIYTSKGMYPEAISEYFKMEELNMTTMASPTQIEKLKKAYSVGGIRAFWRGRIEMLKNPFPHENYKIAQYHFRLGERNEAFYWFKRAYERHEFGFVYFTADPAHSELFADPRFMELGSMFID